MEGHGPSPPKGKGACFAGQRSMELVLGLQGKRIKRKANKTVYQSHQHLKKNGLRVQSNKIKTSRDLGWEGGS